MSGVERDAGVERRRRARREPQAERGGDLADQFGRAAGVAVDEIEVAETRVVVVMVDVHRASAPVAQGHGQSGGGAAVERVKGRRGGRRSGGDESGRQKLGGQRQLDAGVDVEDRHGPEPAEEVEHAGSRPDGVAVGAFVDGQGDLRFGPHRRADRGDLARAVGHGSSGPSPVSRPDRGSSPAPLVRSAPAGAAVGPTPVAADGSSPAASAGPCSPAASGRELAFVSFEEGLDAHAAVDRLVVEELQLGRALGAHVGADALLKVAVGGAQARERLLAGLRAAQHADEDPRMAQVGRRLDAGHRDEPDARILEGGDLLREHLAQGLIDLQEPVSHRASTGSTDFSEHARHLEVAAVEIPVDLVDALVGLTTRRRGENDEHLGQLPAVLPADFGKRRPVPPLQRIAQRVERLPFGLQRAVRRKVQLGEQHADVSVTRHGRLPSSRTPPACPPL